MQIQNSIRSPRDAACAIAIMTLLGMTAFQSAKRFLYPGITLTQSNIITIIVGTVVAALVSYKILTRFNRLTQALAQAEQTYRDTIERHIQEIAVSERQRLGRDLHDGLGQHLAGIEFSAKAIEHRLAGRGVPEAAEVGRLTTLINQAVLQTREISRMLMPVEHDAEGLRSALEHLAAFLTQQVGIECRLTGAEGLTVNHHFAATQLFRVAQEATTNAVKHSKASRLDIEVTAPPGLIVLTIRDHGAGLPPDWEQAPGFGIKLMRRRAQSIGATLDIQSRIGQGTSVVCTWKEAS